MIIMLKLFNIFGSYSSSYPKQKQSSCKKSMRSISSSLRYGYMMLRRSFNLTAVYILVLPSTMSKMWTTYIQTSIILALIIIN